MLSRLGVAAFVVSVVSVRLVAAQQPVWAQCGGIGWTGGTACVSGAVCTKQNDYYSQCLPGVASTTAPTTTSTSTAPTSVPSGLGNANFWFSFGDSYTTTGFDPTLTLPSPENPFGNPAYPGYTGGGGSNWIDVLTTKYNKSLVLAYNYAYGGATIDSALVAPYEPTVLSVKDQVAQFVSGAAAKPASAPWTAANAMFSVWIGINDIGNSYYQSGDRGAFDQELIDTLFALVQQLCNVDCDAGGRNFLFINVPPVDRSPLMLSQGTSATTLESTVIQDYNSRLAAAVASFEAANDGVKTWQWDSHSVFETILNSPTQFGFPDATTYGDGTVDFWGNNYHPGSKAHEIFGQDVAALLNATIW